MNLRRRRSQGKAVFFRFVPCGKLNRTLLTNGCGWCCSQQGMQHNKQTAYLHSKDINQTTPDSVTTKINRYWWWATKQHRIHNIAAWLQEQWKSTATDDELGEKEKRRNWASWKLLSHILPFLWSRNLLPQSNGIPSSNSRKSQTRCIA